MQDASEIHLSRGYFRELATLAGVGIMASGAYKVLGLAGVVAVLLISRAMWWRLWHLLPAKAILDFPNLHQAWLSPIAICLIFRKTRTPRKLDRTWIFRDEVSQAQWAMLRRQALLSCPSQPVGLSISR